ncbi:hypothetical protein [Streptomyces phaeochromogenes]|uniref:hypothetical protein n=1 Tax=Streptomyces phaeochromogenes TaxID=1923 RepID=UPI00386DEF4C|nr:hypothetical protein OG478_52475 [Streptomyces phaeochromogenes]
MTGLWSWVIVGTGAVAAVGVVARMCGYLLRERTRARVMALMARELSARGGLHRDLARTAMCTFAPSDLQLCAASDDGYL